MALQDEIARIKQAKADIKTSIETKGGTVGDGTIDTYASAIDNLPSGEDINEYFETTIDTTNYSYFFTRHVIKKFPPITITITNIQDAFNGYEFSVVPELDTSNVTYMSQLFCEAKRITTIPHFNTSKVTNMYKMFNQCVELKTIPPIDTGKVTDMWRMFYQCYKLESVPELDGSSLTNVEGMFDYVNTYFTDFGGIKDLGKSYSTTQAENYASYTFRLSFCKNLTHDSLMNVINKLYDIKSKGCANQSLVLGATNLAKLTEEEINIAVNKGWSVS